MAITLNTLIFGKVQLSDFVSSEIVLSQSGRHYKKVHSTKEQIQLQINLWEQNQNNKILTDWRTLLSGDITLNSKTYVCLSYQLQILNTQNDTNLKRLIINLVEKG